MFATFECFLFNTLIFGYRKNLHLKLELFHLIGVEPEVTEGFVAISNVKLARFAAS